jgi:hypothetical protein
MKNTVYLDMHIMSFWHAGSGMGRGADVDALVLKGEDNLPYLPGRTVKGLLREGLLSCEEAGVVSSGRTNELFGTPSKPGDPGGSVQGLLRFEDARLSEEERCWLASPEGAEDAANLYVPFASTRLDDKGMAEDKTLRTIELAIPLKLEALIKGPEDGAWVEDLRKACLLVRALGSHRNRGLGRCKCVLRQGGNSRG